MTVIRHCDTIKCSLFLNILCNLWTNDRIFGQDMGQPYIYLFNGEEEQARNE
ncbi:MAG: hypothetical protein WBH57_00040 [Anaerolineae bacterium]